MPQKLLIADDEQKSVIGLTAILEAEGYTVDTAADGQKALDMLTGAGGDQYAAALVDQNMPKVDGMSLLRELRQRQHPVQVIVITGAGSVDLAVEAMRQGAYDFLEKPVNLAKLKALIPKALERAQLQQKNQELETRLEAVTRFGEMVGQSEPMQAVYQMIERVAASTASVLILGESGTGKELVANAIHRKSDRAKGPFFALNCAALPKEILENELFGHEKGAFTGSTNEKPGAFEMASGGTIFLDEVAEMSPDIQVKLLRALETRMVRRLGGKREIPVDIRIVAATNKDLQKAIGDGRAARGPVLPPRRGRDRPAAAARARRRRAAARARVPAALRQGERQAPRRVRRRGHGVDQHVHVAGQRARAAQRGREGRDHGPRPARHGRRPRIAPAPHHGRVRRGRERARRRAARRQQAARGAAQLRQPQRDLEATARTLRVAVAEVRAELQALLERRGADSRPGSPEDRAPGRATAMPTRPSAARPGGRGRRGGRGPGAVAGVRWGRGARRRGACGSTRTAGPPSSSPPTRRRRRAPRRPRRRPARAGAG
jgi:FixJ family two-component response regulator